MGFMKASLYSRQSCELGEGIVYDHRHGELLWIDIEAQHIYRLSDKQLVKYNMPEKIGFISLATQGKYVIGLQSGLYTYDSSANELHLLYDTSSHLSEQKRWNYGKCSPLGDIWCGTMHLDDTQQEQGTLHRLDINGKVHKILEKVSISNGLAWHQDLHRLYYNDSPTRSIQVFAYSSEERDKIELIHQLRLPDDMGYPDGMTIDEDGMLWVAHWDGHCIARWHPVTGQLINKIDIPAPRVTCCTFGGPDKSRLFVTTARTGLTEEQLIQYPLSGSVFVIDTNTQGYESSIYGL